MTEEMSKEMMSLFTNPLFKKNFFDFFVNVQREGIEAAKKFWNLSPQKNTFIPNVLEVYEKMIDFYITLGFVPRTKYDEVLRENQNLRQENKFLKETISEVQSSILTEGGKELQESWREIVGRQLDVNKEIAKNFFELFKQLQGSGR